MVQEAQCARSRCAKKRRAGVGTLLATAGARAWPTLHARGRAVCRTVRIMTRTTRTCPNIRDLILKCTKTHESAQLGLGTQICVIMLAIYWLWRRAGENRNQTIKCRTKIKQSNTTCNTTIPYHPEKESKQSHHVYIFTHRLHTVPHTVTPLYYHYITSTQ